MTLHRKKTNIAEQLKKTINGFKHAGLSGFIIVEHEGNTHIQIVGNKKKAFEAMQTALKQHPLLHAMAEFVNGPKVEVVRQEPELSVDSAPEEQPGTPLGERQPVFAQKQEDSTAEESASITQEEGSE